MKTLITKLSILLFIISLTSCSKSERLSVIPKDSNFVMTVDAKSLIYKADLADLQDLKISKKFTETVKSESKATSKLLDKLKKDPFYTGLDIFNDVIIYTSSPDDKADFICYTMGVKNEDKFNKFVLELNANLELDYKIAAGANFKYMHNQGKEILAWDDDKCVLMRANNYASRKGLLDEITRLFTLKEDNQILKNDAFNSFYKNREDISMFFSSNLFKNSSDYKKAQRKTKYDLSDNYIKMHLNFDDEAIVLNSNVALNKSLRKALKENKMLRNNFNSDLLDYMPKKYLGVLSTSIDTKVYYDFLKKQDDYEDIKKQFQDEYHLDLDAVAAIVKGSTILNWSTMQKQTISYKKYDYFTGDYTNATREDLIGIVSFAFDINDEDTANNFIKKLLEKQQITTKDSYYTFKIDDKFPTYFAVNNKQVLFTNAEENIKLFTEGKALKEDLSDNSIKKEIKSSPVFASLIVDTDQYPKELTQDNFLLRGAKPQAALLKWNAFASHLDYVQNDEKSATLALKLKDGDGNSLNRLIHTIDNIYNTLMN